MTGWIIAGVWTVGTLGAFRPLTRAMFGMDDDEFWHDEWMLVFMVPLAGLLMAALIWPLALAFFTLRMALNDNPETVARVIMGEGRAAKVKRLEREKMEHEAHIRRLEAELGIGVE